MVSKNTIQKLLDYLSSSDVDKSKFGPFYNLFVLPAAQIAEPVDYRLQKLENFQGLNNITTITDEELDIIASNHLVFRKLGSIGTATIKVIVKQAQSLNLPAGTKLQVKVEDKTLEFSLNGVSLSSSDFSVSSQYPTYYVSPAFGATTITTDADYNTIPASSVLTSALTNNNIVHFILDSMTSSVEEQETNDELYLRLLNSVGSRTFGSHGGIYNLFGDYFPQVPIVAIFGNTDEEVTRNRVRFFTPVLDAEEWQILNFKGKVAGSVDIPHFAYEYLLTTSGTEYTIDGNSVVLNGLVSPTNFLLYEAAQDDYNALNMKLSEDYFESGHNVFLSKDSFLTDSAWKLSDAYLGEDQLFSPYEITITGSYYVLGADLTYHDYAQFIKDLFSSRIFDAEDEKLDGR